MDLRVKMTSTSTSATSIGNVTELLRVVVSHVKASRHSIAGIAETVKVVECTEL